MHYVFKNPNIPQVQNRLFQGQDQIFPSWPQHNTHSYLLPFDLYYYMRKELLLQMQKLLSMQPLLHAKKLSLGN